MNGKGTNYKLTLKNDSKNYGRICVFQTMPNQPETMRSLAWFSKEAHPNTKAEFSWTSQYNFIWSEQGELKPSITFKDSQILNTNSLDSCLSYEENSIIRAESLSEEDYGDVSVKPEANSMDDIQPKYYVAFGDFKEGDSIDAAMLENAVELELGGEGKTIVINEDNSISIE